MIIDIHVHTVRNHGFPRDGRTAFTTPAELLERYRELGVDRAVILPIIHPECALSIQGVEEVLEICAAFPDRFLPFCNIDPRQVGNSASADLGGLLEFYRAAGCRGVGEVAASLPFNHPMVENLFSHCQRLGMPLTFHIGPALTGCYGLYDLPGLPLLEGALAGFPELVFLGHSQPFWAEIAPLENPEARNGYPAGPVRRPGRTVELMRRYPNLHGDLSARSGYNALSRDREFGLAFLEEFQDRLYFGTDICAPDTPAPLAGYLLKLKEAGALSPEIYEKVTSRNAIRLLKL